jgi:adenylate cyclase
MTETRRKLTTILSADVQDYTRLMGVDEEGMAGAWSTPGATA